MNETKNTEKLVLRDMLSMKKPRNLNQPLEFRQQTVFFMYVKLVLSIHIYTLYISHIFIIQTVCTNYIFF